MKKVLIFRGLFGFDRVKHTQRHRGYMKERRVIANTRNCKNCYWRCWIVWRWRTIKVTHHCGLWRHRHRRRNGVAYVGTTIIGRGVMNAFCSASNYSRRQTTWSVGAPFYCRLFLLLPLHMIIITVGGEKEEALYAQPPWHLLYC